MKYTPKGKLVPSPPSLKAQVLPSTPNKMKWLNTTMAKHLKVYIVKSITLCKKALQDMIEDHGSSVDSYHFILQFSVG